MNCAEFIPAKNRQKSVIHHLISTLLHFQGVTARIADIIHRVALFLPQAKAFLWTWQPGKQMPTVAWRN